MMRTILMIMAGWLVAVNAMAQDKFVERSTDVLCVVPTLTGLCAAVVKDRPDGTGRHAFPSTHTALAFNGSSFLMKRYGWKWGVPAYAISAYVAWGRTHADKHDWWDVLGGAALGAGAALIFTHEFTKDTDITIAPAVINGNAKGLVARLVF